MNHLAAAFEDDAFVDTQAWGENVSAENRGMMNFHSVLGVNGAVHFAADDDGSGFDLSLNSRALADNQRV